MAIGRLAFNCFDGNQWLTEKKTRVPPHSDILLCKTTGRTLQIRQSATITDIALGRRDGITSALDLAINDRPRR
ncbi:hypothetical protein N8596_00685, partial [bacterium]|nr:hypothetical protein [bacterium]